MSNQEPPYDPYNPPQQQPSDHPQQPSDYPQQYQDPQQYQYQQQYGAQPYSPYQQPGYPGYPAPASGQTNTMAILALVFAFVFSPLGIVFGHIARKQIRERNEQGGGLATAGLILGYVFTAIGLLVCAFYVIVIVALASHGTTNY